LGKGWKPEQAGNQEGGFNDLDMISMRNHTYKSKILFLGFKDEQAMEGFYLLIMLMIHRCQDMLEVSVGDYKTSLSVSLSVHRYLGILNTHTHTSHSEATDSW
jgi:hypothetical protein